MTHAPAPGREARYPSALEKRLQGRVRRFLLDNAILPADGRIVVAVSGGADSTALLLILARLAPTLRLRLHVAHFDHGLRGRPARQRDETFVCALAGSFGLPVSVGCTDVRAVAKLEGLSLEDAARRERYTFLAGVAAQTGSSLVATGHTASDQAETVLLHILRGSGLGGLGGMAAKSPWPFAGHDGLGLARPLLRLSRRDTEVYCAAAGVEPLQDETNLSPDYRRNRVRNEVLPLLRELNPRVDDALVRLADAAARDEAYIDSGVADAIVADGAGAVSLARRQLEAWQPSPRRHALRLALQHLMGDRPDFTEPHLAALEHLALEGKTGDRLDLPRGVSAELTRSDLRLRLAGDVPAALPTEAVRLAVPGEARFGPLLAGAGFEQPQAGEWARLSADAVEGGVTVRRRRAGDRFQPAGLPTEKKLQDFFIDAHVPRALRDSVPLFEAARGIVWAGGLRIAEWARPRPDSAAVFLWFRPAS